MPDFAIEDHDMVWNDDPYEENNDPNYDDGEDGCYIAYPELDNITPVVSGEIRQFDTGATRDSDKEKLDFEGFLSPIVLEEFAKYMHKHRKQSNDELRQSDNWMKGIPKEEYMKSAHRHFMDWWMEHRGYKSREGLIDALMGLLFNVMGYSYELLKEKNKNE